MPDHLPVWLALPLRLLPAHLRHEHERELHRLLAAEHRRHASFGARLRLALWLVFDVCRAAPAAHADVLRQDLTLALRQFRRMPGFTAVAVVTFAVGIGANVLMFSLVRGVLLSPLPYPDPDRLVSVSESKPSEGRLGFGISPANFADLVRDSDRFSAAGAYQNRSGTVLLDDRPDRVLYTAATSGFFAAFGETPAVGRVLGAADDVPGGRAVVLSHHYWRRAFGGDPTAVGRSLMLDGNAYPIVGIMGPTFEFDGADLWVPLGLPTDEWQTRRGARYLSGIARLAPGVTAPAADAALHTRSVALAATHPATNEGWFVGARLLSDDLIGEARAPMLLIWAASALVLLIAVANVANLLLGRALARRSELRLRAALGARLGRIARQMTTEAVVLSGAGAALGLALAAASLGPIRSVGAGAIPRLDAVELGWPSALFAGGLVLLTALLASSLPALTAGRLDGGSDSVARDTGQGRTRWQDVLVSTQVALATFVLIAGALVGRTILGLLDRPLGFRPEAALTFRIEPAWRFGMDGPLDSVMARLEAERQVAASAYRQLGDRLLALPGVSAVGAINRLPLTGNYWVTNVDISSRPAPRPQDRPAPFIRVVTPGYLDAIGTRVIAGRGIGETDVAGGERVVVVDEAFVREYFGGTDPIGETLILDGPPDGPAPVARIVGVVEGVRMSGLESDLRPAMYVPFVQTVEGLSGNWGMDLVVRGGTAGLEEPIRAAVGDLFPGTAVFRLVTIEQLMARSIADRRFQLFVLSLFSGLALLLSAIGVGALLLLGVRRRRREIGIRIALGERPAGIYWAVQRRGLVLVGIGAGIGVAGAAAASGLLGSLVHGISARDPWALIAAPAVLAVAAVVAGAWPAWRATRLDPLAILRDT